MLKARHGARRRFGLWYVSLAVLLVLELSSMA